MVARKAEYLAHLSSDKFLDEYRQKLEANRKPIEEYWNPAPVNPKYLWTDDYYNLLSVVRFRPRD